MEMYAQHLFYLLVSKILKLMEKMYWTKNRNILLPCECCLKHFLVEDVHMSSFLKTNGKAVQSK